MQPYALDLGNGYTKFSRGSTPQMMPSYICEALDPSELCDDIGFGAIIKYTGGERADLAGRIWAVGEAAKTSFPGAFSRVVDSENSTGKVDFALHFALAGLPPMSHGQYFQIPVMYASLPDPALLGSAFKRAIIGTHRYTHNGVEASATIDDVTVLHEGQGAFVYALSQGVFPSGTANAIIDCGNGTTIAQAFSPNGHLIPKSRTVSQVGVFHLLKSIASDIRLKRTLGKEGDIHLIQQAIEDGSLSYGSRNIDISNIYREQRNRWASQALKKALEKFSTMKDEIDTILLIGGGANIVKILAEKKDSIELCPEPQLANVLGLAKLADKRIRTLRSVA